MSTIWVREFTGGLDTRRMPETTPGGALILGRDGHINRGGEFEQRAAFVKTDTLIDGTIGLVPGRASLYVFGTAVSVNVPLGYTYQRLVHPTEPTTALTSILSFDLFAGVVSVIALFADGSKHHYHNGNVVTDLEGVSPPALYGPGDFVRTIGSKVYTTSGSVLGFSGVDAPTGFASSNTGAGFIDMAKQAAGAETLRAVVEYQNYIAIFADGVILIWYVDPDPALNKKSQILKNTSTVAGGSVVGFGDDDIFYLADSGARSLRARDASNAASTTDTGVPIDTLVVEKLQTLTALEKSKIKSVIEPTAGRYWLVMKNEIFVFSFFSGSKVSAWSTYLPTYIVDGVTTTFLPEDVIVYQKRVYLRAGNDVFVYGGTGVVPEFDATEPEMWLPYLDGGKPAAMKTLDGFDCAVEGTWQVSVSLDPTDPNASDKVATVSKSTFREGGRLPLEGDATHVSLRFKGVGTGPKKVSSVLIHFTYDKSGDTDDA